MAVEVAREALMAMENKPLEIWADDTESVCAILVCHDLAKRGLCAHERAEPSLARFTITDAGRQYLATAGNA